MGRNAFILDFKMYGISFTLNLSAFWHLNSIYTSYPGLFIYICLCFFSKTAILFKWLGCCMRSKGLFIFMSLILLECLWYMREIFLNHSHFRLLDFHRWIIRTTSALKNGRKSVPSNVRTPNQILNYVFFKKQFRRRKKYLILRDLG